MKILTSLIAIFLLSNCTENERAKAFGGTMTIELPPQTKLVTATWKDTNSGIFIAQCAKEKRQKLQSFKKILTLECWKEA